jgi:RHS repeat-associated protein
LRVRATSAGSTSTYTWDAAAALPSLLSDGTSGYLSADATLLAETSASANAYPLTDALGSVRAQTDGTGTVTASASYDVFGSVRSSTGSVGSLGYTGALSDGSGLTYLQARELDPSSGTFTSRDPLTPGGSGVTGYNAYAYAGQNPTTYTDPSGRGTRLAELAAILTSETFVFAVAVGLALSITNTLRLCAFGYLDCPGLPTSGVPDIPAPNIPIPNIGLPDIGGMVRTVTERLISLGRGITEEIAKVIATACVALNVASRVASLAGFNAADVCSGRILPVFVSGGTALAFDIHEASQHDFDAITQMGKPALLTYDPLKDYGRWYSSICVSAGMHCDEYPFNKTAEGGPGRADVRRITPMHNSLQGTALGLFYNNPPPLGCNLKSRSDKRFLVIPVPQGFVPTVPICI